MHEMMDGMLLRMLSGDSELYIARQGMYRGETGSDQRLSAFIFLHLSLLQIYRSICSYAITML